jgi:hypothetical protein
VRALARSLRAAKLGAPLVLVRGPRRHGTLGSLRERKRGLRGAPGRTANPARIAPGGQGRWCCSVAVAAIGARPDEQLCFLLLDSKNYGSRTELRLSWRPDEEVNRRSASSSSGARRSLVYLSPAQGLARVIRVFEPLMRLPEEVAKPSEAVRSLF